MDTAADITPFLFEGEHLVRSVDQAGETWFVGLDACRILGIKDHHQALERLDEDERGRCTIPTPMGDQTAIVISEAGIYRLIFTPGSRSRALQAVAGSRGDPVYPEDRQLQRRYRPTRRPEGAPPFPEWPMEEMRTKLKCVDGYRMLWGVTAAQWISPQLGFPTPPPELVERGRQFTLTLVPNAPEAA